MQGWRKRMEDSHISDLSVGTNKNTNVFGVFDGHGGKEVAQYVKKHFTEELVLNASYKKGDLKKATSGVNPEDFKILMSHDPSHWENEIKNHDTHYHLTLSGHTHGLQFGIEIPGLKWSPVQYMYKQWAGLYEQNGQQLYVNMGFGFIGYPGRVGIWPEVSVFTLQKA
jgi:predicted MPP superfamily phosphohydrolase